MAQTTNDIKNGSVLNLDGQLWAVIKFQHVKPGKGPAFVRTTIKNVLSGKIVDKTFNAGMKMEFETVDNRNLQYSYEDGDNFVFMDMTTYDQIMVPKTLVGDKAFCDAHPDIVVKFLRVWLRGVNMIKKEIKNPKLAEQYHRFWTEWAGQDIEPQMAKMDLEYHPVFDIDQQLAIFDDSKGPSQVEQWQDKVLDFFASQGRFSPEEVKKIRGSGYINGTFLKMAAESIKEKPLGGYKLD